MRIRRVTPVLVAVAVTVTLVTPTAAVAVTPQAQPLPMAVSSSQVEAARQRIVADTNRARAAAGLPALISDAALDGISQGCSQRQADNRRMAHCDGYYSSYPGGWTSASENVAAGYNPTNVVNAWMNSPGHRTNILRADATHIGVGYATDASGRTYFTQNFGSYPASVRGLPNGYYRTAYDGTIWKVDPYGTTALTLDQYRQAGSPAWREAPTNYLRFAWSNSISAATALGTRAVWQQLSPTMWSAAGRPAPRVSAWIAGSVLHKWDTSGELFVTDPGGVVHKLTLAEWTAMGKRGYTTRSNQGFVRLSWDKSGAIAQMCDVAGGKGNTLSFSQWQAQGSPTPKTVTRTRGDVVYWGEASSTGRAINYIGAVTNVQLTWNQYQALGRPAPTSTASSGFGCG